MNNKKKHFYSTYEKSKKPLLDNLSSTYSIIQDIINKPSINILEKQIEIEETIRES